MKKLYQVNKKDSKWAWSSADNSFVINAEDAAAFSKLGLLTVTGKTAWLIGEVAIKEFTKNGVASGGGMVTGITGNVVDQLVVITAKASAAKAARKLALIEDEVENAVNN